MVGTKHLELESNLCRLHTSVRYENMLGSPLHRFFFLFGRYLLQGNVRLVGVQSASGRMEARAVLRLLLRSDSMSPALFMDSVYYSTNPDTCLEQQASKPARGSTLFVYVRSIKSLSPSM